MAARDYKASSPGPDLSDKQLQDVAKTLGQEWEQAAIHLGLKNEDLDEIKNEEIAEFMRKYKMLQRWKSRRPQGKTTAQDLLRGLEDLEDLPVETRRLLTELRRIRSELINRLSDDNVIGLLYYLRMMDVLNGQEKKTVEGKMTSEDRACCLIDTVMRKGERASSLMVDYLKERHPDLCWTLGLTPTSARIRFGRSQESFSRKERPGLMSPSLPLEMHEGDSELDLSKVERCHIGTSLTEDTASMSLMDRYEEEDGSDSDASAEIDEVDKDDEEEMHFKTRCEKCKAAHQTPENEKVTPMKISKWSFQVQLEGEGTYECSATGLVFEVSEQALVRYSVLSWFQFSEFLKDSWRPAGSVYDVDVDDPSVLKFIHFPHSLCLAEPEHELSFSVLHVKERHANIETTVDFTASHVKWRVSSLSLLAPIIPESQKIKHHALVLIYKELNKYHKNKFVFHLFLASNYDSEIQAINKQVLKSRKKCIKIYKPAACRLEEKFYHLTSEPERNIEPPKLEFVTEVLALKGFSEACFGERPPFRLFLMDSDCDELLWSATIREDDWNGEKSNLWKIFRFLSRKSHGANSRQRVAAGTSDFRSSPRLSLVHEKCRSKMDPGHVSSTPAPSSESQPAGQATSSPPAPSRATQAAGHPTSSTTSSPPAPSRATQAAGHPTSSTTSSPPATSRATQAAGYPTSSTTSRPPAPSRATQAAGHPTSSTTSRPPAPSRATQAAGHTTSSTTSRPPAPSRATLAAGHPTSSTTSSPPAPSRATPAAGHPTSSTTSSPPATSRATQAAGHPTSSTTSSPPAPSRATQAAGHPTSSTTSSPPATSRATQAAGHTTSSTTSSPPAPSRATQAAGHPTSSTTSSPPATSRATQAAGHPTSSTTSSPPAPSRATPAEGELQRIRSEFVKRVSIKVIKGLLDDLLQQKVFSTEEKDSLMEELRSTTDRARCLIDEVMKKGERASQVMIDSMKVRDNHLCLTLEL
ncbi:uncharacterized protein LOC132475110 isoform X3 [Gadus macrocephalus]|uniref:uncharacterized protein LOC132475110 isoform X3 n=1 Tax=Gadus macrocephalus TaxID=80720 RepID=UPI0028CB2ABC|nr:uncharacterized protein LOC132475110 isoform X3 [Gadus macrocephalus]